MLTDSHNGVLVQDFLSKQNIDIGTYALVTYDTCTEAIWFSKFPLMKNGSDWFLESPCQLYEVGLGCPQYEIINYQCAPYLPKYVDKIEIISEEQCLEYLLNNK